MTQLLTLVAISNSLVFGAGTFTNTILSGDVSAGLPKGMTKTKCATMRDKLLKKYLERDESVYTEEIRSLNGYITITDPGYQMEIEPTPESLRAQAAALEKKQAADKIKRQKDAAFYALRDEYRKNCK